jgi:hypothetical protein
MPLPAIILFGCTNCRASNTHGLTDSVTYGAGLELAVGLPFHLTGAPSPDQQIFFPGPFHGSSRQISGLVFSLYFYIPA